MDITRRDLLKFLLALPACRTAPMPQVATPILSEIESKKIKYEGRKALIVNGAPEEYHLENIIRAMKFLRGTGYKESDITILSPSYDTLVQEPIAHWRYLCQEQLGFSLPSIAGPATVRNIEYSLEKLLGNSAVAPEEFFLYITGHGGSEGNSSYAVLQRRVQEHEPDKLADRYLAVLLQKMNFKQAITLFDGCEGQGFAVNLGNERIKSFAKTKFGNEATCAFFAEHFFNAPWRAAADDNRDGLISLNEAIQYTRTILEAGGAPIDLFEAGREYQRILSTVSEKQREWGGTFPISLPNDEIEWMPTAGPPDFLLYDLFKRSVFVDSRQKVKQALADKDARFYFMSPGCPPCQHLKPYLLEILNDIDETKGPVLYVVASGYDEDRQEIIPSDIHKTIAAEVGTITSWPTMVKRIGGKVTEEMKGLPKDMYRYGDLPDKEVYGFGKKKLREMLS